MHLRGLVYLLPLIALWSLAGLSPAATMIAIATTLFLAIKTHVLLMYRNGVFGGKPSELNGSFQAVDLILWFSVWWGLQPREFFQRTGPKPLDSFAMLLTVVKILFGAILFAVVAPKMVSESGTVFGQWIGGWVGMVGVVFLMHFGYSHLSAVVLNSKGYPVKPIMNFPLISKTVSEFWGRRWNVAFRDYAHVTLFSPLSRRYGVLFGTIAGFVFSGVIHELAISVPAGGGFGWPMLYFAIQAAGAVVERRLHKSKRMLAGSTANRCWTILVVLVPAPLLFHRQFVFEVINPIVRCCDLSSLLS